METSSNTSVTPDPASLLSEVKRNGELVSWITNAHKEMKAARNKTQLKWDISISFFAGKQYLEFTTAQGGRLMVPKAPKHRVRLTVNRIRPMIRTELARLTQQKPSASVIPATSEDEDMAAAFAAEQIWESVSRNSKAPRAFREAAFWTVVCGTGFIKTWWDKTAGPVAPDPANPLGPGIPLGDVKFAAVTPYHLFVPLLRITDIQEQPYVLSVHTMTLAAARMQYGEMLKGMESKVCSSNELLSDIVLDLNGNNAEPDSVMCYEMWVKPNGCKYLPNGGLVHVIGDRVVYCSDKGIPYSHGQYPFTKIEHIPTGVFYTESSITDVRPLQQEYNRVRSQITEARNRMAKPQWVAQAGSVDVSRMTTEPGQVIQYTPGMAPPTQVALTPLPGYVIQEQDRILSDIEDLSGQHQVSTGSAPTGVTAATAISFLQEKDDGILSTTYASVEEAWENIAYQTLNLVVQYWDQERTVRTTGADAGFDVMLLKGSDIKNNTDVVMEGGSALPVSKAARQALLMDMMKMGFISPQDGLKMLDMGGTQRLWERLRIDESQAQRENIKLKKVDPALIQQFQEAQAQLLQSTPQASVDGINSPQPTPMESLLPVNSWDNHAIHIEVHNTFRKTQQFELLPDAVKIEFESHVNMHVAAANQAMQQASMAQGTPVATNQDPNGGIPSGEQPSA